METDSMACCKGKLAYFRIKELKDILSLLGLPKQGKKQDLLDRVTGLLSDDEICSARGLARKKKIGKEAVVKIIDDAYRKMQITDSSDLAAKAPNGFDIMSVKEEVEYFTSPGKMIRCPCGSSLPTEFMIQCIDSKCQVQQHISCVIFTENPMDSERPPVFYCETCRIARADPFWVTVAHLLFPVKLPSSNISMDGNNTLQNVEATFQLTRSDQHRLQNCEYDVQAWCMLLNDKVLFRMQWPQHADLHVNGMPVRTLNRPGSQSLGASGRDDGALIKLCIEEGINRVSLSRRDSRVFCFGIRLVKRQTVEQVLNLIPKDGEPFEDALARVCRCIGGGMGTTNEDSDSDLEVIAEAITVNLRCPISGSRMKIAGRFKPCVHMGCFDLETFVTVNQRSRKWQCPVCLKNYSLEDIVMDPYFNRITTMMSHCEDDITEIEVKPDGSWTAKTKVEIGDLGKWHFPDGSLCAFMDEVTSCHEISRQIEKGDGSPEIGTKCYLGGMMQGRKHQLAFCSSKNQSEGNFVNHGQRTKTSRNTTRSGRYEEDPSINQDYSGQVEIFPSNVNDSDSICHFFYPTIATNNVNFVPSGNADIIDLSDSDEENTNLVPPEVVCNTCPVDGSFSSLAANPGIEGSYLEDLALDAGADSCFDLFDRGVNDVEISSWSYSSSTQAGAHFQLFNTDSDFIDLEHSSISCAAPMNGSTLASTPTIISGGEVPDSLVCDAGAYMDVGFVDNPMRFVSEDPSLQTFLPAQPVQPDLVHQPPVSNPVPTEDWISLRLGSTNESFGNHTMDHTQCPAKDGVDLQNHLGSNQVAALNDEARSKRKYNKKISGGPFSFPRQPRSVRRDYSQ
ncbi:ZINC FINGER MIZ DOMAIN-CONTAINING PROTEIN [Salix koriyanagi]|uniref:ZINC FINGER MIZ DOMAIN-CONTAINING PROTEIN n=1 Tax=Salix koriyanagi TaxID=2511006 RepID=A0A9Q1AE71_9ROSI|nr:ZINC FINGER MIZ DOMAIN-CONTAINING PROTEIN [Salix koriyanagi]